MKPRSDLSRGFVISATAMPEIRDPAVIVGSNRLCLASDAVIEDMRFLLGWLLIPHSCAAAKQIASSRF
jgi:hypothetical protein